METDKIDKRSKEYKASIQKPEGLKSGAALEAEYQESKQHRLEKFFEAGLPISACTFHSAVNNADNTPESFFSETSQNPSRKVAMSLQANGSVICKQKNTFFFVGASTVNFGKFKI